MGGGKPDDVGHVAQPQRRAVSEIDDRCSARSCGRLSSIDCRTAMRWLGVSTESAAGHGRGVGHGALTRRRASRRAPQPLGIDQHLILPIALAPDRDVRHARNRHQSRADRPLGQDRQIHLRERFRRSCRSSASGWSTRAARGSPAGAPRPASRLVSTASRSCTTCRDAIKSVPSFENQHHRRQPEHRFRPDRLQPDECR